VRWRRAADAVLPAAAWLVGLGVVAVAAAHALSRLPNRLTDLNVYRAAGLAVRHHHSLYVPSFSAHLFENLKFTYPPFAAVLFTPLSLVHSGVAALAWDSGCIAALFAIVLIAFRGLRSRVGSGWPALCGLITVAVLSSAPVMDVLNFGQVDLFLVLLCLLDLTAPGGRWPRGVLIGLCTAVKLTPGLFIVALVLARRFRAAAAATMAFALATALGAVVAPGDSWRYWTGLVLQPGRTGSTAGWRNQALFGVARHLLAPGWATPVWLIVALAVAVAAVGYAARALRHGDTLEAAVAVGVASVLLAPVAWIHEMVWVVPAAGAIVGTARSWHRVLLAVAAVALCTPDLPLYGQHLLADHAAPTWAAQIVRSAFGLCLLVVLAALAVHRRHGGRYAATASGSVIDSVPATRAGENTSSQTTRAVSNASRGATSQARC
jgi:alpha-1,2-mannosyltransferase